MHSLSNDITPTPTRPQIKHHLELSRQAAEAASASVSANDRPKKLSHPTRTEPQPLTRPILQEDKTEIVELLSGSGKNSLLNCLHCTPIL